MAKKRAFVDAVLSATRSSGIFTQDVEELEEEEVLKQKRTKNNNSININNKKTVEAKELPITKDQQTKIVLTINKNNLPIEYAKELMKERYKVNESKMLTSNQADEFIDLLKCSILI